ncbi:MAG: inositol monophosphatase family protein [Candidatus Woesebacteria bacterium]|jgi:myo-inositol-1(or 4)-monophosphatase
MLQILKPIVKKAGSKLFSQFGQQISVSYKSSKQDLLTKPDVEIQHFIKEEITDALVNKGINKKEIGFIGEENLDSQGRHLFVMDPIDGTTNFVSNIRYFAISIAYFFEGKLISGVTFDPCSKTLFYAEKAKGAFKLSRGKKTRLKVEKRKLSESIFNTYISAYPEVRARILKVIQKLFPKIRAMRSWGCGTLEAAELADNKIQVLINGNSWIWDIATAKLLLNESGALLTDWQGNELEFDIANHNKAYEIIACQPQNLEKIVAIISSALRN